MNNNIEGIMINTKDIIHNEEEEIQGEFHSKVSMTMSI